MRLGPGGFGFAAGPPSSGRGSAIVVVLIVAVLLFEYADGRGGRRGLGHVFFKCENKIFYAMLVFLVFG